MPAIKFPASSTPGRLTGEGEGRLINAYVEKLGDGFYWRRSPGLTAYVETGRSGPRGMIDVDGVIYAAFSGAVVRVSGTSVSVLSGSLPGTGLVTFARNNRVVDGVASPQIVCVANGAAYVISGSSVSPYPTTYDVTTTTSTTDPVTGVVTTTTTVTTVTQGITGLTVNSVSFLDGYFLFTIPDGRIFASGLNTTDVDPLSFATAEAKPDGLVRGFVHGGTFFAAGPSTIEPWRNTGGAPFPLLRASSIIPVGLFGEGSLAGIEEGWDHNPLFVAHDRTVREITGYTAKPVSTPDVEAFIGQVAGDPSLLEALTFTFRGHAAYALSSPYGTWIYDVSTGKWHERVSQGQSRWRASRSVRSANRWVVGDKLSGALMRVDGTSPTEKGTAIVWTVESAPLKDFPARTAIPALHADFTLARGSGSAQISWSLDGGGTWIGPFSRSLGAAGHYVGPIRVNRLGLASHHGLRVRLSVPDTVDFSFMGASVPDVDPRRP